VAILDISVPKMRLMEEVLLAGLALANTLFDPTINDPFSLVPECIIVALCCWGR